MRAWIRIALSYTGAFLISTVVSLLRTSASMVLTGTYVNLQALHYVPSFRCGVCHHMRGHRLSCGYCRLLLFALHYCHPIRCRRSGTRVF